MIHTSEQQARELFSKLGKSDAIAGAKRVMKNDPSRSAFWLEVVEKIKIIAKEEK